MKALIYSRVSSKKQITEGNGLDTQESLCKKIADQKGYDIVQIYREPGISGQTIEARPQLKKMLEYLKKTKEPHVIIVENQSRLSRDTVDSIRITDIIRTHGHILETVQGTVPLDKPSDKLVNTIQSATAQYQREEIAKQSKQNMKDLVRRGCWILKPPTGYKYVRKGKTPDKDNRLIRKEPEASIIQQALIKYSTAELDTQTDVAKFLENEFKSYNLSPHKNIMDFVKRTLTEKKYAGYFSYKPWGISERKGNIEPLIDLKTYAIIQERLKGKNRLANSKYDKDCEDFPLRGFVQCPFCGRNLTASYSKGGKYPYYQCQNTKCPNRREVNVSPSVIHKDFLELLHNISLRQTIRAKFEPMALEIYNNIQKNLTAENTRRQKELESLSQEIETATSNLLQLNTTLPEIRIACEQQIEKLIEQKNSLQSELDNHKQEIMPFNEALNYFFNFTSNLPNIWETSDLQGKRNLLSIIFSDKLIYTKQGKFETPKIYPVFQIINLSDIADITGIPCFFDPIVPNLKNYCDFKKPENIIFGTDDFPQIFNKNTPIIGGQSYLVP